MLSEAALRPFRRQFQPVWSPNRLKALRRALNATQSGFSTIIGTERHSVTRWETGVQIPKMAVQRLIWLLERSIQGRPVTLEALLTWADD